MDPNTPPLVIVNVPPTMSSSSILPSLAFKLILCSSYKFIFNSNYYFLNACITQILAVPENWDNQSTWSSHSYTNINEISVDNITLVNDCVDNWLLLEGGGGSSNEGTHEA